MKVVCATIVGPGEADRHLDRVLASASRWADQLVAVADHVDESTETALLEEIQLGVAVNEIERNVVDVWWENNGPSFLDDESHTRNVLMRQLDVRCDEGDLIVVLDADEELLDVDGSPGGVRAVLEGLAALPDAQAFGATFFHLWAPDGSVYRCDATWAPDNQFRIYRHVHGERIEQRRLACSAIPSSATPRIRTGLTVAHWGYARPSDRVAKYERYMEIDGGRHHNRRHLESILERGTVRPFPMT